MLCAKGFVGAGAGCMRVTGWIRFTGNITPPDMKVPLSGLGEVSVGALEAGSGQARFLDEGLGVDGWARLLDLDTRINKRIHLGCGQHTCEEVPCRRLQKEETSCGPEGSVKIEAL